MKLSEEQKKSRRKKGKLRENSWQFKICLSYEPRVETGTGSEEIKFIRILKNEKWRGKRKSLQFDAAGVDL